MATTHYHRVADLDRRARRAAACGEAVLGPPGGICPARLDFSSGSYCVPSQGAADAIANPRMARVRGVDFERELLLCGVGARGDLYDAHAEPQAQARPSLA